jgi:hypothetical protein
MNCPGIRRQTAGDQIEQRRLAGAVWTDDADSFTRCNGKFDVIGRYHGAEALAQTVDLQQ